MTEPIHTHPGCAVSWCGGVAILLWTGQPTLAANRWAVGLIVAAQDEPERRDGVLLQIIAEDAGLPDSDTRVYIQKVFERELSGLRRVVSAPLGDGFRQAVLRTIVRGIALVAGKSSYMLVVSTLEDAYDAVLARRASPSRAALHARVLAMFEALGAPAP